MFSTARMALFAALLAGVAGPVFAADFVEPPVVEQAPPPVAYQEPADFGGWYIRGDIDYHWSEFGGGDYTTYSGTAPQNPGSFASGSLKGAFSAGAGVGYQVNRYFRTDLTFDWMGKSDFRGSTNGFCTGGTVACTSTDTSSYSAMLLLANAYVDIGTWHGVTPYVGAGIGGAWVKWDTLHNTDSRWCFRTHGRQGLALCLRPHGRRLLLPDRPGQARCRLSLQPHQWRQDVRIRFGQQCRPGLRSTASTCTKCAAVCATSSAGPTALLRRSPMCRSRSRSTPSNRFDFRPSPTARPCRAVFVCAASVRVRPFPNQDQRSKTGSLSAADLQWGKCSSQNPAEINSLTLCYP